MSVSARRLTAAAVTLLATVAASAVLVTPAHAAGLSGKERVTSSTAKDTTAQKTHQVSCPDGKVAISGGGYVDGPGTVRLDLLRPAGPSFEAGATSTSGRPAWALHVYAICAFPPDGLTYVSTPSAPTPATIMRLVIAYCPQGTELLGIGARAATQPGRNVALDWVIPDGDLNAAVAHTWVAEGGESVPWTTEAYAVCAAPLGASVLEDHGPMDSMSGKSMFASCPAGGLVAGGAAIFFSSGGNGQVWLTGVYPGDLTSTVAFGAEDATGTGHPWRVAVFSVCA